MTLPPPCEPRKIDPEDLVREIEDDALTQLVWSIAPETSKALRKLSGIVKRLRARPPVENRNQCVEPSQHF